MKEIRAKLVGLAPQIQHNGELADPLNPWVRAMKKLHSKPAKQKTDDDINELYRLEFYGSLYTDKPIAPTGNMDAKVVWPSANIEALIRDGAKKSRQGKQVQAGAFCQDEFFYLQYDGPKNVADMWDDGRFHFIRTAKVNNSRVRRSRPRFSNWSLEISITIMPDVVDEEVIRDSLTVAGQLIGLSDWKPKYGRFEVEWL